MTITEILPLEYEPGPANDTRSSAGQVRDELRQRNERNLERWHVQHFGPVAGRVLAKGYHVTPSTT